MLKTTVFVVAMLSGGAATAQLMPGSVDRSKMAPNMAMPGQIREAKALVQMMATAKACGLSSPKVQEGTAFIDGWNRTHIHPDGRPMTQAMAGVADMSKFNASPAKPMLCRAAAAELNAPKTIRSIDTKVAYLKRCGPAYRGNMC